jgi:membrane protein insertase Oxa1/YidC/SpoIIIJ
MIPILSVSPLLYTTQLALCTFDNPERIDFAKYWYNESPIQTKLMVGSLKYLPALFHFGYGVLLIIVAYSVAIILARMTLAEVNRNSKNMSPKTKSMQKQLER